MQNTTPLRNITERPSALVCIAYRQVSVMTGTKDPTEKPKVQEVQNGIMEKNALLKKSFADFKVNYVETCLEFSKDMMESLRLLLEELKVRFEQFREQPQSILDFFSLSNVLNWTKGEPINETMNEKLPKH
ncbi:uncharacterized protein LOC143207992 [Lasioglossum baleicum]|uniref:uncharacterized protein LOC143207992 n=1 Tax=Lasioglossum baleicum TaxID=434251 RepID=UPI003FCD7FE3